MHAFIKCDILINMSKCFTKYNTDSVLRHLGFIYETKFNVHNLIPLAIYIGRIIEIWRVLKIPSLNCPLF